MKRLPSCALALLAVCLAVQSTPAGEQPPVVFARTNAITEAVKKTKAAIVQVRVSRPNGAKDTIGAGVIVSDDGAIITNQHVIGAAEKAVIRFADGSETTAQALVGETHYDLAILKIKNAKNLAFLKPAPVSDLMVGESVIAIGNPHGYSHSVSRGIISALDREITMPAGDAIGGLIQTDASINPGNSGGPLLNINGEWIGVNLALRQDAHGIAFAINAGTVEKFLRRHLNADKVAGVAHGLKLAHKILGPIGEDRQRVVVNQVNGPAEVREGDEIVAVGQSRVATAFDVERALWTSRPGDQVQLKVMRQGRALTLTLTLAASQGAGTTTLEPVRPASVGPRGSVQTGRER
jgi:serine protease Do